MPYTPPSQRTPSSSTASSPAVSRRSSIHAASATPPVPHAPHTALPRSSSYLARHRRTSSAPTTTSEPSLPSMVSTHQKSRSSAKHDSASLRQSPPPVTADRRGIPSGAVISPPDSPHSSSDDESTNLRGRRIGNVHELKQLHEAVSQLPMQRRAASPSETPDVAVEAPRLEIKTHSFSTGSLDQLSRCGTSVSGRNGRRVSHVRSATEPNVTVTPPSGVSLAGSDEDDDLELCQKPQMVRKKSGELVRPALRLGSRRRPLSMPGTPTFSKAVHFDSHLEHVRHFLQVDRPLAVSAGSSPVETYDSETEYPFGGSLSQQILQDQQSQQRNLPFEWEITLTKFPAETPARAALPVRLERVWLSADQKSLNGSVAVANIAFAKSVTCRFTLDYWKTTSEIAAEYSAEIRPRTTPLGHDRFNFMIKLSDLANLESKTLFFCIRYNVDGKEFWDNNDGNNFQIDFKKKMLPMNGKSGLQRPNDLPRSNRRSSSTLVPRPISMPASLDDFDNGKVNFDQSLYEYLGEPVPALRLKTSLSTPSLPSDNLSSGLTAPSGLAFANRYDFGASLSAAVQAAKDSMSHRTFAKPSRKATAASSSPAAPQPNVEAKAPMVISLPTNTLGRDAKAMLAKTGAFYDPGSFASQSYDEIVSKYCFYVPNQSTQSRDTSSQTAQVDGVAGEFVTQSQSSPPSSAEGSPILMGSGFLRHPSTALRHSIPSRSSSAATIRASKEDTAASAGQTPYMQMPRSPPSITHSANSSTSSSPVSPSSANDAYTSYAGTPPSEYTFMQDRFPFNGGDSHATAIKG